MIGNFPAVLNLNRLFLKLNRFITNCRFSPIIGHKLLSLFLADRKHHMPKIFEELVIVIPISTTTNKEMKALAI
jgi:hypothetical protein